MIATHARGGWFPLPLLAALALLLLPAALGAQQLPEAERWSVVVPELPVAAVAIAAAPLAQEPAPDRRERNDAMINGGLIAVGALGIFDNVVNHWILELHRAVPPPYALEVEIGLVVVSTGMLALGLWRERQARRR